MDQTTTTDEAGRMTLMIEGMDCQGCVRSVDNADATHFLWIARHSVCPVARCSCQLSGAFLSVEQGYQ